MNTRFVACVYELRTDNTIEGGGMNHLQNETGRVGYLVLYLLGAPVGLLLLLWVLLGNNIFGAG